MPVFECQMGVRRTPRVPMSSILIVVVEMSERSLAEYNQQDACHPDVAQSTHVAFSL